MNAVSACGASSILLMAPLPMAPEIFAAKEANVDDFVARSGMQLETCKMKRGMRIQD